ncbi:MAG: sulfatase-like hydrolase/transferase [Acidobacteriota bacterium]|nr:sulfatase-like hydrolase/transferase [Acidobacteriota bacterium]
MELQRLRLLLLCLVGACLGAQTHPLSAERQAPAAPPNILFIVMDDVGIDQMKVFGYGDDTLPRTPTIDQISHAGVRFGNAWAMPACSTSRATFFTGRFPLRTNVQGALGPDDLANSQLNPHEMTVPRLLKKDYRSALFGKFHVGLQGNNPFRDAMPLSLGWHRYEGALDESGDPGSIDTTAGGVATAGKSYSCGFVPAAVDGGADAGACYSASSGCEQMTTTVPGIPPGRTCRDRGGIFDPGKSCTAPTPAYVDFTRKNGHYVSPYMINYESGRVERLPPTDARARTFRGTVVVDGAIEWIKRQPKQSPWMTTVSFSSAHTPLMQPPAALLASGAAATSGLDCANVNQQRILMNQMVEAMDTEIGRLLIETGIARPGPNGQLTYDPAQSDTMIVIVGDNGSLGSTVKPPFDPPRAKGTAYQTGVWVPLIAAGPLVRQPDRTVTHMVNVVDLFRLFGEIGGVDVPGTVTHPIDAVSMLPYLTNPAQGSLRTTNFTQVGVNVQANGAMNGPCQISSTCTQIPVTKGVCEDNGGIWWGAGATDPLTTGIPQGGLTHCCDVNVWRASRGQPTYTIQPLTSVALRNEHFKIVRNEARPYDAAANSCVATATTTTEFYAIDEHAPRPKLDTADANLLNQDLTPLQQQNFNALNAELQTVLGSARPPCPGDGNLDGVVDDADRRQWQYYTAGASGGSSWYDFNLDGKTDGLDLAIIRENLGKTCAK